MQNLTWAAPILPGKRDAWNSFMDELQGPRRHEHAASRREMGLHREVVSVMSTPAGDFVCLYHEADDLAQAFAVLATSSSPYLQWFRQECLEIHGLTPDMLLGPPPAEFRYDWQD
jgi:hypothetical protein